MTFALATNGLYRATVDPTPIIDRPAGGVELIGLRRKHSKSFALPSGLNRQIISIGPQHYYAGGWHDIDCSLQAWDRATYECLRTPYIFRSHEGGIGCMYKSREGGFARMRLLHAAGKTLRNVPSEAAGNCLYYRDVATDADVHFQLRPAKVSAWTTLHSRHAPRSWTWEFIHSPPVGIAMTVRGWDALGRPAEIKVERSTTRLKNGTYRTLLTKRWTGAVWERDPETRKRRRVEPEYPVVLDPDISEEMVNEFDDGTENNGTWNRYFTGLGQPFNSYHAMWRWRTIAVAQGVTIDLATFKIKPYSHSGSGGAGTIYGYDTDDAAIWSNTIKPSTVAKTSATATVTAGTGTTDRSFDITTIVQEIINRAGWVSDNDLGIVGLETSASGNNTNWYDYASSGKHGRLEIDYTAGGAATPKGWFGKALHGPLLRNVR